MIIIIAIIARNAVPRRAVNLKEMIPVDCSLGSFNTGFSCSKNLVCIQPCPHFKERADQREVTLREQLLCLKYGTIFQLGGIRIVQTGLEQGDIVITVIGVASK